MTGLSPSSLIYTGLDEFLEFPSGVRAYCGNFELAENKISTPKKLIELQKIFRQYGFKATILETREFRDEFPNMSSASYNINYKMISHILLSEKIMERLERMFGSKTHSISNDSY